MGALKDGLGGGAAGGGIKEQYERTIDLTNLVPGTETDGTLIKAGTNSSPIVFSTASQYGVKMFMQNTATTGTFVGMRFRTQCNAASGTPAMDGVLIQSSVESSTNAGTINALFVEFIPKGTNTVTTVRGMLLNSDSAAGQTYTTKIGLHVRTHTRGDETVTNDELIRLENQAVGGNGRELDSWINLTTTSLSGGIKAAGYIIDAGTATDTMGTALLRVGDDQTICSDDNQAILVDISGTANDGFIKVIVGTSTKYIALYDTKTS